MSTTATTSTTGSAALVYDPSQAKRVVQKTMGQDDFLKILVAQLAAQDPTSPVKDTDFIGQMAQFNSLEQTSAMQTELKQLRQDQQTTQASNMLGKNVTFQEEKDNPKTTSGTVSAVVIEAGTPQIKVGNRFYEVSKLYSLTLNNVQPQIP